MSWPTLNPGCRVPASLQEITSIGKEETADNSAIGPGQIGKIWRLAEYLYRSGARSPITL